MVAVVGVTPVGATSAPQSALTNDDLPALNSPITAIKSGRSNASAARPVAAARPTSAGVALARAWAHPSRPASCPTGGAPGAPARATNRRPASLGASRPSQSRSASLASPSTMAASAENVDVGSPRGIAASASRSSAPSACAMRASGGGGAPSAVSRAAASSAWRQRPVRVAASRAAAQARGSPGASATDDSASATASSARSAARRNRTSAACSATSPGARTSPSRSSASARPASAITAAASAKIAGWAFSARAARVSHSEASRSPRRASTRP